MYSQLTIMYTYAAVGYQIADTHKVVKSPDPYTVPICILRDTIIVPPIAIAVLSDPVSQLHAVPVPTTAAASAGAEVT